MLRLYGDTAIVSSPVAAESDSHYFSTNRVEIYGMYFKSHRVCLKMLIQLISDQVRPGLAAVEGPPANGWPSLKSCQRAEVSIGGETGHAEEFTSLRCGGILRLVPHYRMAEIAELFGVSDDTVRRWADSGQLTAIRDAGGRKAVDGVELAAFAKSLAHATPDPSMVDRSARNRFVGLVTEVIADRVVAQVEMQCGPHRVVSLMSSEAVRELGLVPGVLAVAVVKSTQVVVETPGGRA